MKKKKINQIVFYFYGASFCILLVVLLAFTAFFSKQEKSEQSDRLREYVISTQGRIASTVDSMQYMQKRLYSDSVYLLKDDDSGHKSSMLDNLFIFRDINKEDVYSVLFDNSQNYKIITSDTEQNIISDILRIYRNSVKDKPYTTFFYDKEKNPKAIYIYNSQPVTYSNTKSVENYIIGISVLVSKINIPEYARYFAYGPSVEIALKSQGKPIYIKQQKNPASVISTYSCDIGGTEWKICGKVFSGNNLFERQSLFKLFIVQAFFIILSLLILFQIIYKKYIMKPINQISDFLSEYIILNKTVEIPQQTSYEFDKIAKYISRMVSKNRELIRQIFKNQQTIYEKEIESKAYKFYALKAQINPHFLYNTLDCISSLAYLNDVEPIADITNVLSKILRYTITEQPYTTVKDEVELLENYFSIIKIRYPGRFNYHINADEKLADCKILHMLLQPIAENSVKHNNLFARKLIIYVKIYASDDHINCIIMDNGIGMPSEKQNRLNKSLAEPISADTYTTPTSSHIGIHNINSRIKLMYGNEYGIQLSGAENKYIKISVKIPIEN